MMRRYTPDVKKGLTESEINERIKEQLVNYDTTVPTKTIPTIIFGNIFTLFNLLNFFLGLTIFIVGSYKNLLFLGIVFCNTLISTLQEIRSKKIIDKLSLIAACKVCVVRDQKEQFVNPNELVLDDIVILKSGNQVVADAIIIEGTCEVNESFITGESDPIVKQEGDLILSGSFIIQGRVISKVEHVGTDNYTSKISKDAKYIKKLNSELMKSLNKIIKFISLIILPIGLLLFMNQINIENNTIKLAVVNTVAALIGMIPEGLILLTSTVLAVSTIRLANKKVLVQELYCIETLARVDTICLDKTGTITEGYMEVEDVIPLGDTNISEILCAFTSSVEDSNATIEAISRKYNNQTNLKVISTVPFSSIHKYSAITVEKKGTYVLGATEIVIKSIESTLASQINEYANENRVLILGHTNLPIINKKLPNDIKPIAIVLLKDKIRFQAKKTLEYFKKQGVDIKIISGDGLTTVRAISKRVGVSNLKGLDVSTIDINSITNIDEYGIFARVKPDEKKLIIERLKNMGHVVAMTGDGVNDVLALKEADCSITIANATDAARNVSQLVLMDSNFDSMPDIVYEGRRTINNIERSASLFLVKTIYATLLAIIFIFISVPYPFMPIQFTLINFTTIGIPSFILALEPNKDRIKGKFLINVLSKAFPTSLTIVICIVIITILKSIFHLTQIEASTLSVAIAAFAGFRILFKISVPFNNIRKILFVSMITIFIFQVICLRDLFSLAVVNYRMMIFILALCCIGIILFDIITRLFNIIVKKYPKIFETK